MERLKGYLNKNKNIKRILHRLMMPKSRPRPRWWVRKFINPWVHKKGKGSFIYHRTRMDLFPFNHFSLGINSVIEDFTTVNNGVGDVFIGNNARIGLGNTLIGPVHIGNNVRLAQNVVLSGLNHNYQDISMPISEQGVVVKNIFIGEDSWIGANAVILPGVNIGKHCVIAAGSIVTKSVPDYAVAAGNPAKIKKQYNYDSNTWENISNNKIQPA